jgi:copper chaperone NosL
VKRAAILLLTGLFLVACDETPEVAAVPDPQEPTRDAIGYYCNMIVVDHIGPKGQIFLTDREEPIWFTSVRDTIAFTMLPEEPRNIAAAYVHDIGRTDWDRQAPGTWVRAREAWYVVGSPMRGGMGAPEAVPFGDRAAAEAFADEHGGTVVAFADIPSEAILGDVDPPPMNHE